jgi:hypothetical protein
MSDSKYVIDFQRWSGGEMDAVGEAVGFTYKEKWYALLYTKAGMFRGNHFHNNNQYSMLLDGKGKYIYIVDGVKKEHELERNVPFHMPAGIPHILLPEEDCLTVEWWDGPFAAEEHDFPEYMDNIRKKIEKLENS